MRSRRSARARWKPPLPAPRWKGTRDATQFGPACVQPKSRPGSIYSWELPAMSEDCLSLNIWAPAKASKAPVFVWIHGGSLSTGAGSDGLYDGTRLAERGIIVVTINYRLGVLGYLAHPALSAESRRNISGNYGLLDQIAALRWVKHNIAAFGGDAANVTIAGESAGGLSVMYLHGRAARRAACSRRRSTQSAYMISTPELRTAAYGDFAAEAVGVWLAGKLGASDLAGLRSMDAAAITNAAAAAGYLPFGTVDGRVLPRQLVEIFDRGEQAKVPMLAGFNSGEIRSLRLLAPPAPADAATYEKRDPRALCAISPATSSRSIPSSDLPESVLATTRDALYGWTAERLVAQADRCGRAVVPLLLRSRLSGGGRARACTASTRASCPTCSARRTRRRRTGRPSRDTAEETRLSDAMLELLGVVRARRRAERRGRSRPGPPMAQIARTWPSKTRPGPRPTCCPACTSSTRQVVCRRRAQGGIPWNWNVGLASPPLPAEAPQCQ